MCVAVVRLSSPVQSVVCPRALVRCVRPPSTRQKAPAATTSSKSNPKVTLRATLDDYGDAGSTRHPAGSPLRLIRALCWWGKGWPTASDKGDYTESKGGQHPLLRSPPFEALERPSNSDPSHPHALHHIKISLSASFVDTMPKLSSKHLDLTLGAKSWRPAQRGERVTTGGIHASRGRFLPSTSASASASVLSSPPASLDGDDPRVHFASGSPSSVGRSPTPSSDPSGLGQGMTDEEFEWHAKELGDAQAAQLQAAEVQRLAQVAAEAEAAEELQRKKLEELLKAQEELAEREREVKEKEDRIAALMRQEEQRHAEEVAKMEASARREEDERRARLERLDREEAERKANLEKLEQQRREERLEQEEQEVLKRLEAERQRLAEEERLEIENKIKEEEAAREAKQASMRAQILAYVPSFVFARDG